MLFITVISFCLLAFASAISEQSSSLKQYVANSGIAGNKVATRNEFPHLVSIQIKGKNKPWDHFCTGAVISKEWVLTAASCMDGIKQDAEIRVQAGIDELEKTNNKTQESKIEVMKSHKKYEPSKVISTNDISLLKLEKPLKLNEYVEQVNLPKPFEEPDGQFLFAGFGSMGKIQKKLQKFVIPFVRRDFCSEHLSKIGNETYVQQTQICTGPFEANEESCKGDFGGPLIQEVGGKPVLFGIASWLVEPCGKYSSVIVHTKISYYLDWISENTKSKL